MTETCQDDPKVDREEKGVGVQGSRVVPPVKLPSHRCPVLSNTPVSSLPRSFPSRETTV